MLVQCAVEFVILVLQFQDLAPRFIACIIIGLTMGVPMFIRLLPEQ